MIRTRNNVSLESSSSTQDSELQTFDQLSLEKSAQQPKGFRKMYIAAFAALSNGLCMGLVLGYSSPAIPSMEDPCSYFHLQKSQEPWFGSLMAIGALFGALSGGPATNYLGRKDSLLLCSVLFSFGWLIIPYSKTIVLLYFARVLTGFASGLVTSAAPMYVVEISTPEVRGLLGAAFQLFVVMGVLIAMVLGYLMPWEWLAVSCSILSAFSLLLLTPMPRSPRWLIMKKKSGDAIEAITFLQGNRVDPIKECDRIEVEINSQPQGGFRWDDARDPCVWKPFLLSMGLMYFQQYTGVNAIMFYASNIFKSTGSALNSQVASIVVAAVQVVATLAGSILMDRAGRKALLLICGFGTATSLAAMGAYFYLSVKGGKPFEEAYSWIALLCLMVFIASFSVGLGPIPWLMVAEMVPQRVRSLIAAIASGFNWCAVFIVTNTFSTMEDKLKPYGTYWFYSANCILCILFSAFLLPETKGKAFQDIQKMFRRRSFRKQGKIESSVVSIRELVDE